MKKFFLFWTAGFVLISAGCRSTISQKQTSSPRELKAVLYVDAGASGNGVHHWAMLLKYSPGIRLYMMTAADIRAEKLDGMDLLLLPGGYAPAQYKALQEKGAEAIRKFVSRGGAYVGTCAGLASVLNDNNRLKLLPFHRLKNTGGRNSIDHIEAMFRLNSHPQIDIKLIGGQEINEGDLRHLDMLVLPAANADVYKKTGQNDFIRQEFLNFMARGGRIFVTGNASNALPGITGTISVENNQALMPELLLKNL